MKTINEIVEILKSMGIGYQTKFFKHLVDLGLYSNVDVARTVILNMCKTKPMRSWQIVQRSELDAHFEIWYMRELSYTKHREKFEKMQKWCNKLNKYWSEHGVA